MDKYELSIKEDKIKKHAEKKDYAAAVKIADTIDWSKIKNIKMLTLVSQVYEKAKNYEEAKNVLLFAYERVPMGRRMLYKLTELCVKGGEIEEAEGYFEEFQKIAPNDIGKLLLAYQIEAAKGGDINQLITILELYRKKEFEEKWAYELAYLYHKAGRVQECVQLCKEIILWFSVGTYVDRALNLKMQYEPLTPAEQEKLVNKKKFEARVRAVEREFEKREYRGIQEDDGEDIEWRRQKEQIEEAAMTSEAAGEETSSPEEQDPGEAVVTEEIVLEQEPPVAVSVEEETLSGKVIPFSAAQPSEKETAGELYQMQEDLAQAVQAAEEETVTLGGEAAFEDQAGDDGFGQTKEVVKETRKALKEGTEVDLGATGEFLNDMSAALAAAAFPEEPAAKEIPAGSEEEPLFREEISSEETEEPAVPEEEPEPQEESSGKTEEEPPAYEEEPGVQEEFPSEETEEPAVPEEEPEPQEEGLTEDEPLSEFEITCVVVEAEPGAERIPFAVEKLKKTHEVLGSKTTQVAKISGEKLSEKGVHNTFKRLAGRDLIVDNAADLSHEAAAELVEEMKRPAASLVLILVDSSERLDELLEANPKLDQLCVYLEEDSQMDIDAFVACANDYAKEEECVIEEMANLAIYAVAERLQDDGTELTEEAAKKLVDEAIDRAEHRGIKGLFGSKYDKEGYLILKEQFFKN